MAQIQRRRGKIQIRLNPDEREALLMTVEVLQPGIANTALAQPKAYDNPEYQAEYARWVHGELEQSRNGDVNCIREGLNAGEDALVLNDAQGLAWVRALTHLRLAAGQKLGIKGDEWETKATDSDRDSTEYRMLATLGWIQEELVTALEA